ncbi:hypothetical protein GCM10022245_65480 [Streptomyces mayteni]
MASRPGNDVHSHGWRVRRAWSTAVLGLGDQTTVRQLPTPHDDVGHSDEGPDGLGPDWAVWRAALFRRGYVAPAREAGVDGGTIGPGGAAPGLRLPPSPRDSLTARWR